MDVHDLGLRVKNHVATNSVFVLLDKDAGRRAKSATNFSSARWISGISREKTRTEVQDSLTKAYRLLRLASSVELCGCPLLQPVWISGRNV
jgi:uncharacterized UPF0160 family protein